MKSPRSGTTERVGVQLTGTAFERAGFAFRLQSIDFGIDALAERIHDDAASGQLLAMQIKSGPSYFSEEDGDAFVFRFGDRHRTYWLEHSLPVVICLCDVDTGKVYWESVVPETIQSTGKNNKILVPKRQTVDPAHADGLAALVSPVVASSRYTVIGPEDLSHALAKRYSFDVLLNGTATKAEGAAILRQVTNEGAKRSYNRNDIAARRWGSSDADVVWAYLYPSAEDLAARNRAASSQWISDDLDAASRPFKLKGEDLGDGLVIEWSGMYASISKLHASHTLAKEEYLQLADRLLATLPEAHDRLARGVASVAASRLDERRFIESVGGELALIGAADRELQDSGFAPYECTDLDLKLSSYVSHLGNVVLYFTAEEFLSRDQANRLWLAQKSLFDATQDLDRLRYEREKIR